MRYSYDDLLYLMSRLRDPDSGCPWDLEQDFETIAPYTLEETCEVLEAIASKDYENLREELGDLLFQVIFYAWMAQEQSFFDISDVVHDLVCKMVRRHPHVFPDGNLRTGRNPEDSITSEQVIDNWEQIKQQEKGKVLHLPLPLPLPCRSNYLPHYRLWKEPGKSRRQLLKPDLTGLPRNLCMRKSRKKLWRFNRPVKMGKDRCELPRKLAIYCLPALTWPGI